MNVTLIVQFAPAATLAPQLFVCAKSPLIWTLVIVNGLTVSLFVMYSIAVPWKRIVTVSPVWFVHLYEPPEWNARVTVDHVPV